MNPELSESASDQKKLWSLIQEYEDILSDVHTPTNIVAYDRQVKMYQSDTNLKRFLLT